MRIGLIGARAASAPSTRETLDRAAVGRLARRHRRRPGGHPRGRRNARRRAVASPRKLLAAGVDGVVIAAATAAHPELILAAVEAGHADVLREAGGARPWPRPSRCPTGRRDAACPIQIGYPRRFDAGLRRRPEGRSRAASSDGCTPCAPRRWTRPRRRAAYLAVSGGIFRDCSIHDFDAVRWVTGQEVVEVYATGVEPGRPGLRRHRRRRPSPRPCSPSTTAPARWCPTAATTPAATTCAWRCTARTDSIAAGLDEGCRCARRSRA